MASHVIGALEQGLTVIDGITDSSLSPGIQNFHVKADGLVYRTIAGVSEIMPMLPFSTIKIDTILNLIGVSGKAIEAGWTPLSAYFTEIAALGTRETTGVKVSVTDGLIVPRTLSCDQGGMASLSCEILPAKSDGTVPYTITDDQTVPAADASEWYSLGPISINSVAVGNLMSINIDFGIDVLREGFDGSVYPKLIYKRLINPTIRARVKSAAPLVDYGVAGSCYAAAVTLLKRNCGGLAGSGDLTLETEEGRVMVETVGGTDDGEVVSDLMIIATYDGTNAPLRITA